MRTCLLPIRDRLNRMSCRVEDADTVRPADAADANAVCLPTDASVLLRNVAAVVVRFVKGVVKLY